MKDKGRGTRDEGRRTIDFASIVLLLSSFVFFLFLAFPAHSKEATPQYWSVEVRSGFWMPTDNITERFFNKCCNLVHAVDGGFLYKGRYGVELGAGVMSENGFAVGGGSGAVSADRFNLFLIPVETNAVWRAEFKENQIVVPYVKGGVDYIFFRENIKGETVKGLKSGLHGAGGVQFSLEWIDSDRSLEADYGINDVFIILEARFGWINSFGRTGLDLSGPLYSAGLLFEF